MDRNAIIGIALAIGLFILASSMQKNRPPAPAPAETPATEAVESATPAPAPVVPTPAPAPAETVAPAPVEVQTVPEETHALENAAVSYVFTNQGGGVAFLELRHHQGAQPGEIMTLNRGAAFPIGALTLKPDAPRNDAWTVAAVQADRIVYQSETGSVAVEKTYTLHADPEGQYRLMLEIAFTNQSAGPLEYPSYFLFTGQAGQLHANDFPHHIGFDYFAGGGNNFVKTSWFTPGFLSKFGIGNPVAKPFYAQSPGNVDWVGVRGQYFTTMILPEMPGKGVWARPVDLKVEEAEVKGIEGFLEMPGFRLEPGATERFQFTLYTGPANLQQMQALGRNATAMMNMDRMWITRTVGNLLLRAMDTIHGFISKWTWIEKWSWALSIIILTFIVRGLLWPLQGKANRSMKLMQQLMPKQTELREKYKDDPARMNQEVMKLYKEYGVNPVGGCLPMLIQIPIFIGFYSMLGTAVELRNAGFLWISDLSRPDTVAVIAGFPINILPLLMSATMIWQMRITPKAGDPMQQKMMMFMPVVFILFMYNFASALALYWTVSNLLSVLQLYVTRNQPMPELVKKNAPPKKRK